MFVSDHQCGIEFEGRNLIPTQSKRDQDWVCQVGFYLNSLFVVVLNYYAF